MGRSVSYATGAAWVLYCDPGLYENEACYECVAESGAVDPECDVCDGAGEIEADYDTCKWRWDDFLDCLRSEFQRAFPSMYECDEWVGREDRAVLENRHAYIGVSEYMGLVSVWCKPKESYSDEPSTALAEHWAACIEAKAKRTLDRFTSRLVRLGTFSNGEGVYQRAA